jgi:alpha-mannosidase
MGKNKNKKKEMLKQVMREPGHVRTLRKIKRTAYEVVAPLKATVLKSDEPIKFSDIDISGFKKIRFMKKWADKFGCAWFNFKGAVPKKAAGKKIVLRLKLQGEGLVFDEKGNILQGITQILSKGDLFHCTVGKQIVNIVEESTGDEKVNIFVDAGFNGLLMFEKVSARLRRFDIAIENPEIVQYYYDYLMAFSMMLIEKEGERFEKFDKTLKEARKIWKKEGAVKASEHIKAVLHEPVDESLTEFSAIGHAHIDLAWKWPIRETKRKIARTFANQLRNIGIYDDFVFAQSQPQMFEWLKEDYPALFEKVKEQIKNNRIEPQGGMWVESDCNLTSGESWVRQAMYGKKYWKENFGQDMRLCWLPDVFGFPATLPQVFKKCGMDYFFTVKICGNWVNTFPHKTFEWSGIDGTSVLAHMSPLGDYNSGASPLAIVRSNERNSENGLVSKALLCYGDGDGGGGPGEGHIEYIKRHKKGIRGLNPLRPRKSIEFYDDLIKEINIIPKYQGELYYERHQGTYTSQAKCKTNNRRIEELLHYVEWLGAEAFLKEILYDKEKVEKIWKEVLLYQFHDILPGSSIKRVYDECNARYEIMMKELEEIKDDLIEKLSDGKKALTAINSAPFKRSEFIKYHKDNKLYKAEIEPNATATLTSTTPSADLKFTENSIESDKIKVVFNENGEILSLFDKENNFESAKEGEYLNRFTVYSDPKMTYNAWDISMDYADLEKFTPELLSTKNIINDVFVKRENTYAFNKSVIVQEIVLYAGENLVRFDTEVHWHESYKLLRADFVPAVFSDTVECDIQFGTFNRSTKNDTSIEKAQFEICAQKYINLENEKHGFALFNDSKYGHKVKEGFVSLALLRSPKWPDPTCDMGEHYFSYAIYPHGKVGTAKLKEIGYNFNNKIDITDYALDIKTSFSFDNENIIIETIKVSENNEGIIIRAYETNGKTQKTNLKSPLKTATECDMLENKLAEISLSNINFKPYEIKTILLV